MEFGSVWERTHKMHANATGSSFHNIKVNKGLDTISKLQYSDRHHPRSCFIYINHCRSVDGL